jgi:hypothetical protein
MSMYHYKISITDTNDRTKISAITNKFWSEIKNVKIMDIERLYKTHHYYSF